MHIAVVGCGYWGPNIVRNLVASTKCNKVTCCDLDSKKLSRLKSRFPDNTYVTDFQDILNNTNIDGIIIATPISTHFPLAKQALESGKHVFIEKPLTASIKQAEILLEIAERLNRIIMVGHTFLFSPPVNKIQQIIEEKQLGNIYYISTSRVNLGLHQKDVSVIWDLAPHDFSILFYWLKQTPSKIWAVGKDYILKGIPDVSFITMEFPSGTQAYLQISWLAPIKLRRTAIVGSKKMLVFDDTESVEKIKIFDKGVKYKDPETFGEFQLSYRSGDIWSPQIETYEPLQKEIEYFLTSIQEGSLKICNGHDGLQVVKVLEAAEQSMKQNGIPINID